MVPFMRGKGLKSLGIALLEKAQVRRVLSVWELFAIGYGDLGSSIYYALGITVFFALGAAPIALGLAGLVFVCTALSYAELSSVYHESGGSASFARHAFNDIASFIAGWGLLLDYIVTIAISAFAVAPYLSVFFLHLEDKSWHVGFSCLIIVLLYILNFFGIKRSTRTSLILAAFAILTQLIVLILGCFSILNLPKVFAQMRIGVPGVPWSPTWDQFVHGFAMAMVAYTGIESIAQLGSESMKPAKNLPRAIFLNIIVLLVMYFGIAIVGLSVMTPLELGTTYVDNPLAAIASTLPFGGEWFQIWVGILGGVLLFVSANAGMIGSSRLAYNMSEYYQLPRVFSSIHPKFRTPYISLFLFASLAIVIILLSRAKLSFLADLYNFGAMIAFFFTNLSLIVLRIKQPGMKRPFAIPFHLKLFGKKIPLTAVIGCLATLSVWIMIVLTKPEGRILGLTWMALGLAMYFYYRRKRGLELRSIRIEKVKVPYLEPLEIKHILVSVHALKDHETIQLACEIAKRHSAHLTLAYVMEIPLSLPVDALLPTRTAHAEQILKRSEAIAREADIPLETVLLRGRFFNKELLELVKERKVDLVISDWKGGLSERFVSHCPCRVWLLRN